MPKATMPPTKKKSTKSAPARVRKTAPEQAEVPEITIPRSNQEYLHWTIFVVVSVLVAFTVIYAGRSDSSSNAAMIPSPTTQSKSTTKEAPPYVPEPTSKTAQSEQGVIGKVLSVTADTLTLESIAPTKEGAAIGTVYTTKITSATKFVYHPVTSKKDSTTKTFGAEAGNLANIKKGMYASATTLSDVNKQTTFDAIEVNYSEASPLE